ncbi:2-oxoacid:acceptor oxidoreductase family protein [Bacillus sp. EB106-08-02-XG196]|jgi:2-oxoglutarate ferredoxin oxidoreductase subunit gamma|uniref:2-oxoacid:acceptor oxidoreductase family protein n=1 Tax=Bacillus sp. EB106-08-02-XG196 TaxID=2737049 RepID=UPI0015C46C30|nr:2-oxoacid:acceptor oxidoreductase family protein [Bacillus sp. EB106-08-02-XG196]NWQ44107.1 2-oxoacid:acceptor oxidoreductase family protein [Bacillus sp. EB106-08-02-XG196]
MLEEIIVAGFGGQGVMSMGQLIAYAGMLEGKGVSWLPSYGPEQRGGTANCAVVVSDEPVGSPLVTNPSTAIVLNNPSFDKFEPRVRPGGLLIINSSLVTRVSERSDIEIIELTATDIAADLGNARVANMILLGAFIELTKVVSSESIIQSLKKVLSEEKYHLIEVNRQALNKGLSSVKTA